MNYLKCGAKSVCYFKSGALFTDLSLYENVAFPLRVHTQLPENIIRDIVMMKLEAVGLRGAYCKCPMNYPGYGPSSGSGPRHCVGSRVSYV